MTATRPLPELRDQDTVMIGDCPEILEIKRTIARVADTDLRVLILGASGTGKELVAEMLHSGSGRAKGPFVAVNCAAIPDDLLEAELFGVEKGAFTGAETRRIGRFERAHGGSIFLDEIGDMAPALQAKILRVLQENVVERLGGDRAIELDIRVVSATNKDLDQAVEDGEFRSDLLYRVRDLELHLPPLRRRGSDIDALILHFAAHWAKTRGRRIRGIDEAVFERFHENALSGNVRDVSAALDVAITLSDGPVLRPEHLPGWFSRSANPVPHTAEDGSFISLEELERRHVIRALRETRGNQTAAAALLGVSRNTVKRKIEKYGLS